MVYRNIQNRLRAAVSAVLPEADLEIVQVQPCPDPKLGDYRSASLMALAKQHELDLRQLACLVLTRLEVGEWCEPVEIAGTGFVNFRLRGAVVESALRTAASGQHLFFERSSSPQTIVLDFSSPNVAKAMHVGHIRSTLLGDCIARLMRLLGHRVIADNHLGDWGTQFGIMLLGWKTRLNPDALGTDPLLEMERVYQLLNLECDEKKSQFNPATRDQARQELVKLQKGDEENLRIWRQLRELSQVQFEAIYQRLGVKFDHTLGESFYNPWLQVVVDELITRGIARESEGARCVFSDGSVPPGEDPFLIHKDGEWRPDPCIIQKSDGACNYSTTDLATLAYRLETWNPDEIIYVTGAEQQAHFRKIFATFRRWHPESAVKLTHLWFGAINGPDGKRLTTRDGNTLKLATLLNDAEKFAFEAATARHPEWPEAQRREIASVVGTGAVKYSDLLPRRETNYILNLARMLSLEGNTAPYIQYAYTRLRSILRKSEVAEPLAVFVLADTTKVPILGSCEEAALAKKLMTFGLALDAAAKECRPNYLCNYLHELAGLSNRFCEACPVLKSSSPTREFRLALCALTSDVLKAGLTTLGIGVVEQM